MKPVLYVWEGDVCVHIIGSDATPPNARAEIQVHPGQIWTGTLQLRQKAPQPRDTWVFTTKEGSDHTFRVVATSGRTVTIEQLNTVIPPPGRRRVRDAEGSLVVVVHGRPVDRALTTVEIFNDDTWFAVLRLEGSGDYLIDGKQVHLGTGDRFNLQADRDGSMPVVARVHEINLSASADDVAVTMVVSSWADSPPPL